jgi:hypothetical protein
MPAESTYTAIATTTLGTATNPITFSSIPQTYTDLVIVVAGRGTGSNTIDSTLSYFNSNTGTNNYSNTFLYGDGATAYATQNTNAVYFAFGTHPGNNATANVFGAEVFHVLNYSNTTTFKTVISRSSTDIGGSGQTWLSANLWRQTSAINTIQLYTSAGNWAVGTKFSIYGIKAA